MLGVDVECRNIFATRLWQKWLQPTIISDCSQIMHMRCNCFSHQETFQDGCSSLQTGCLLVSGEPGFPVPRFPVYRLQFTEWHGRSPPMTGIFLTGKNCLSGNSVFVMLLLSGIFTCVPGKETLICFENSCVFNFPRLGDFPD